MNKNRPHDPSTWRFYDFTHIKVCPDKEKVDADMPQREETHCPLDEAVVGFDIIIAYNNELWYRIQLSVEQLHILLQLAW